MIDLQNCLSPKKIVTRFLGLRFFSSNDSLGQKSCWVFAGASKLILCGVSSVVCCVSQILGLRLVENIFVIEVEVDELFLLVVS